ncbi:MAG: response regulator [Armatimonadetes bacterium]|nr:response regulator [Armatimonadota bacterium]
MTARFLTQHGYRVTAAATGRGALRACAETKTPFALILCDVVLPDIRGPDLVEKIAAACPGAKAVLMSGYRDGRVDWERIRRQGYPFLQKPFNAPKLLKTLREQLGPQGV